MQLEQWRTERLSTRDRLVASGLDTYGFDRELGRGSRFPLRFPVIAGINMRLCPITPSDQVLHFGKPQWQPYPVERCGSMRRGFRME